MLRFFTEHPTAANLLMAGLIFFGVFALPGLPLETFPKLPLDKVSVQTVYRGAAPEDVADAVCTRVEDALDAVENLDELRCEAQLGVASVTVEMVEGGDIDRFLDDIKTEVEAIDDFPDGVDAPIVEVLGRNDFVAAIAVTGPMSETDLKLLAEQLKQALQRIPELSEITISGFSDRQIRIELTQEALDRHGVSLQDIANTVARQNVTRPVGEIDGETRTMLLRLTEERRDPDAIADLVVIGAESGAEVRLGEIASVQGKFEDAHTRFEVDGKRAALLRINKSRTADTLLAIDALQAFLDQQRAILHEGVTLTLTQDVSSVVRDRLAMLVTNAWQGMLLVIAVLWVFFGTRFSVWVAMGLPVSFLGSLGLMALLGISINMITMVGLLISIGLLMDDALVIAENIATKHQKGLSPVDAARVGTMEVLPGVGLSFMTTVAVFGSLAFIGGDLGQILKFVPIVLIMTMSVSLIEAFLILPNHLSHSLGGRDLGTRFREKANATLEHMSRTLAGRAADLAVRYRYLSLGLTIFAILGVVSFLGGGVLKFQAFPDLEGDVVVAQILLPQGTPMSRTRSVVEEVTAALTTVEEQLGAAKTAPLIQQVSVEYGKNAEAFETGAHVATVTVDLLSAEVRDTKSDEILNLWRQQVGVLPDVLWLRFADFQIGVAGRPLEIRLSGLAPEKLKEASWDLIDWLSAYEGVEDVADDLRPGKPEARITLRSGARSLGLTASDLADQIATGFLGRVASEIQIGPEKTEIDLRFAPTDRNALADLEEMRIQLPDGRTAPLTTVAHVREGRGWARLHRIDGTVTVTVFGEIDRNRANVTEVLADTANRFLPQLLADHPGMTVAIMGEQDAAGETQADIGQAMTTGILGVFLLLCFQFRSYSLPPLVIMLIPASFIGVVLGHMLVGFSFSMPSMVGFVALAGVAVNGAILMVEFVRQEVAQGYTIEEAAVHAAKRRFRAIFLTSVTTVFGLLPLLLETSLQARILQPLVVSLVFGLIAAAILGMMIVPCLLAILHDLGWKLPEDGKS